MDFKKWVILTDRVNEHDSWYTLLGADLSVQLQLPIHSLADEQRGSIHEQNNSGILHELCQDGVCPWKSTTHSHLNCFDFSVKSHENEIWKTI